MKKKVQVMTKKRDSLNGDHSFKNWFKIMWKNGYIFIFLVGLVGTILEIVNFGWVKETIEGVASMDGVFLGIFTGLGLSVPPLMLGIVVWKGFIQFWNDLKNGRSR